jgi:hypothetical protein
MPDMLFRTWWKGAPTTKIAGIKGTVRRKKKLTRVSIYIRRCNLAADIFFTLKTLKGQPPLNLIKMFTAFKNIKTSLNGSKWGTPLKLVADM